MEANCVAAGLPTLSHSQAMLIAHISLGERRAIRLADKLGISRQATHILINNMVEAGVLETRADPQDGRAMIVELASTSIPIRNLQIAISKALEQKLVERFGKDAMSIFQRLLAENWGEPPILSSDEIKNAAAAYHLKIPAISRDKLAKKPSMRKARQKSTKR